MLCMFSALHHCTVLLVLVWMTVLEQVLEAGASLVVLGQLPGLNAQKPLSVAVGALGALPQSASLMACCCGQSLARCSVQLAHTCWPLWPACVYLHARPSVSCCAPRPEAGACVMLTWSCAR